MADSSPGKAVYKVVERTCQVVMDVTVRVTEITRESVAEHFTPSESGEGLPWEWAERQNRFLAEFMKDGEAFGRILVSFAMDDLGLILGSERIKGMPDGEEDRLYERIYSRLNLSGKHSPQLAAIYWLSEQVYPKESQCLAAAVPHRLPGQIPESSLYRRG